MKDTLDKRFQDCYLPLGSQPITADSFGALILGLPSDLGVTLNGGRAGAHLAPLQFRQFFNKLTPHPLMSALPTLIDFGDLEFLPSQPIESIQAYTQQFINTQICQYHTLNRNLIPCFIGGGHDFAYPTLNAFLSSVTAPEQLIIINVDAHLDVRSTQFKGAHSGTPFFQLLSEYPWVGPQFFEWGIQPGSCSAHHYQWLKQTGAGVSFADGRGDLFQTWLTAKQSKLAKGQKLQLYLSIDMDVFQASQAPGCSAPAGLGVGLNDFLNWLKGWYSQTELCFLGVYEVAPILDLGHITSRLAALLTHHLLTEQWFQMCKQLK